MKFLESYVNEIRNGKIIHMDYLDNFLRQMILFFVEKIDLQLLQGNVKGLMDGIQKLRLDDQYHIAPKDQKGMIIVPLEESCFEVITVNPEISKCIEVNAKELGFLKFLSSLDIDIQIEATSQKGFFSIDCARISSILNPVLETELCPIRLAKTLQEFAREENSLIFGVRLKNELCNMAISIVNIRTKGEMKLEAKKEGIDDDLKAKLRAAFEGNNKQILNQLLGQTLEKVNIAGIEDDIYFHAKDGILHGRLRDFHNESEGIHLKYVANPVLRISIIPKRKSLLTVCGMEEGLYNMAKEIISLFPIGDKK